MFSIASGGLHGLPIDAQQREELFLTAAQSFFAVAVLSNLSMSVREAWLLFALFWAQFIVGALVPASWHAAELIGVGRIYLALGTWVLVRRPAAIAPAPARRIPRRRMHELAEPGTAGRPPVASAVWIPVRSSRR